MDGSRLRRDGANQASKSLGYSVIYTCISGLLIVVSKQNFVSLSFRRIFSYRLSFLADPGPNKSKITLNHDKEAHQGSASAFYSLI